MTPLAATILDYAIAGVFFFIPGIWSIFLGLRLRYGTIPYFVANYTGWTSVSLSLPFGGVFMLVCGITPFASQLPNWAIQAVYTAGFFPTVVGFSGFYIRFPKSLTPKWYRRALKAGVPRNDPYLMGKFKALNKNTQKELIQIYKDHRAGTRSEKSRT